MQDIKELSLPELKNKLRQWQYPDFHAVQIFNWIYQRGVLAFVKMTDLPAGLRRKLEENFSLGSLKLKEILVSRDGTEKFLLELKDRYVIEAVMIPAEDRATGCVSTQVGCKFGCLFCSSGLGGFKRDLSPAEILEEVLYLKYNSKGKNLTHLVFMGIGEPLDNYDNVLKAIRTVNSKDGLGLGARRITISTCGIIPGIKRLSGEKLQIELSISLHSPDDKTRSLLVPVNKKYPLRDLVAACREYIKKTNRQITFEYVLIKEINSGLPSAQKLSKISKILKTCKVNLIPANPVKEKNIQPPNKLEILLFRDWLLKSGINVTLRKARGQDILAACGQLRLSYEKK
jgi:23S rRNA (adenine2503-C2)-methyltransferase